MQVPREERIVEEEDTKPVFEARRYFANHTRVGYVDPDIFWASYSVDATKFVRMVLSHRDAGVGF